jgi:cobalt/nickel transport system permease protein
MDGVLTWPWLAGGFVAAGVLAVIGAWRIRDEEIPQVAVMSAAFFVASLIHVRVPPTSVHMLLNGLVGVVLGRRAALAIPIGLVLQVILIGHGGLATLGVNSCDMVIPALLGWMLFVVLQRLPWLRQVWFRGLLVAFSVLVWLLCLAFALALIWQQSTVSAAAFTRQPIVVLSALGLAVAAAEAERRLQNGPEFAIGLLIGQLTVLMTTGLTAVVLAWGGEARWPRLAEFFFLAHLPIAAVEGAVLGFTLSFLARVKPEMLHLPVPEDPQCSAEPLR